MQDVVVLSPNEQLAILNLAQLVRPLTDNRLQDYEPIFERAWQVDLLAVSDGSHGTHEFFQERALIAHVLLNAPRPDRFGALAIEWDWPDVYELKQALKDGSTQHVVQALLRFNRRFPAFMWSNREFLHFLLQQQRLGLPFELYGLDMYSLEESVNQLVQTVSPGLAMDAWQRLACSVQENVPSLACAQQVDRYTRHLQSTMRMADNLPHPATLNAYFNSEVARDMSQYKRLRNVPQAVVWNRREQHMADVAQQLAHLTTARHRQRMLLWAHNSHVWNAAATGLIGRSNPMSSVGEYLRKMRGRNLLSVGFLTFRGTVSCASTWNGPVGVKDVPPAVSDSYEFLFHQIAMHLNCRGFVLDLLDPRVRHVIQTLIPTRKQRAIGAVYQNRPLSVEMQHHYLTAQLCDQFDMIVFLDETHHSQVIR